MSNNADFIRPQIDPAMQRKRFSDAQMHADNDSGVAVNSLWVKAKYLVVFREMLNMIMESIQQNKAARIVVEYDPRQEKFFIGTVTKYDEADRKEAASPDG